MEMLTLNASELILTILNFFLLMFLLKRFLYTPIITFMDARNARIAASLDREKEAQTAMEEQQRRHDDLRRESTAQAKQVLSQAKAEQERELEQMTAQARQQAAQNRKNAQAAARAQNEAEQQVLADRRDMLAELLARQLMPQQ